MNKTYVIGDIHGAYLALLYVLNQITIQTEDTYVFLGDYVDGWSQSPEVIDFLIDLNLKAKCVFIKGNHDDLLLNWLNGDFSKLNINKWYMHGGEATVNAYKNVSESKKQTHIEFLKSLKNYHLDSENRLYVHAGFTNPKGIAYENFPNMVFWDRTLWETALCIDGIIEPDYKYYPKRLSLYKEIYIGHTPISKTENCLPIQKTNVWNIDTGAAYKGSLSVIEVETKQIWQSLPVFQLYPDEIGREI